MTCCRCEESLYLDDPHPPGGWTVIWPGARRHPRRPHPCLSRGMDHVRRGTRVGAGAARGVASGGVNKSTPLGNRLQVEKTKSERASNRVTIACKLGHRCSHFTDRAPVLGPPLGPRRPPRLLRSRCPIARTRGVGQEVQGRRTRKCRRRVAPDPGSRRLSGLCQRRGAVAARGTTAGLSAANDGCMLCQKARRPEHEALDQGQALVPVAG